MTVPLFLLAWVGVLFGFIAGCAWRGTRDINEIEVDKLRAALSISHRIIRDQKEMIARLAGSPQ
jgi:hypothetical protein